MIREYQCRLRRDEPDALWHVTGRVNWQIWHLKTEEAYRLFLRQVKRAMREFSVTLYAHVEMSNHYHLVVQSPPEATFRALTGRRTKCRHFRAYPPGHGKASVIAQFMRSVMVEVSKQRHKELGVSGRFWDGPHHRRRLRDPWDFLVAIAYDHRNPVRKGMAPTAEEFPRSSAAWWATGVPGPVRLCGRPDFAFGLDRAAFRKALLDFQREKQLDDVLEAFARTGLRMDSETGRARLEQMFAEAGLDPLALLNGAARVPQCDDTTQA